MAFRRYLIVALFAFAVLSAPSVRAQTPAPASHPTSTPYAGDLGIFEDPGREQRLQINRVMDLLHIKPGSTVADIGAGGGWFSVRAARRVGPKGRVIAEDINPKYIAYARRKYKREFAVADVSSYDQRPSDGYDLILVNSFLHHLDTLDCSKILQRLATWLSADGYIHLLELVLPEDRSTSQFLARADRGKFVRPLGEWRKLFEDHLEIAVFEPYPMRLAGTTLWNMVYCKAKAKS